MLTKYDKIKDSSYCFFAMHSFSVHAHGKARACCVSRDKSKSYLEGYNDLISLKDVHGSSQYKVVNSLDDFVNDPVLMKMRKDMLSGDRPEACKRCWNLEEQGIESFRQINNTTYSDLIDTDISHIDKDGRMNISSIKYLDITLGNVCNLKCRSCNPWNSHRWIEEGPHLPHTNWTKSAYDTGKLSSDAPWFARAFAEGLFDEVLPNITSINFLGGEPLVVEEHYEWLQKIIEMGHSGHINLLYNTNATTIPDKLYDIWKEYKGVNLGISIDAIGDLAYYVRHPSKWKVIERNMTKLAEFTKQHKNIFVQMHGTLSCLNLHDLPNLLEWSKKNYESWHYTWKWGNYGYQNCIPHFNIVEYPSYMHIKHLPDEIKESLNDMLDREYEKYSNMDLNEWEYISVNNIKGIKNTLNQKRDPAEWQKFIENTKASDKFRNLNIVDYVPWMAKYI